MDMLRGVGVLDSEGCNTYEMGMLCEALKHTFKASSKRSACITIRLDRKIIR